MVSVMSTPGPFRNLWAGLHARLGSRIGDAVLSDRLKGLAAAAACLVLLLGLFGLHRLVESLEHHYLAARADMIRLQTQISTNAWQQRQQQSQVLKSVLEERLWTAQTPGLADAGYERWLRERMGRYKMEPSQQIQIRHVAAAARAATAAATPDSLADVQRMTAKIVLPFDPQGLTQFLADVAEAEKTVVIDRLSMHAGRNSRVEMDISAFFWSREKS